MFETSRFFCNLTWNILNIMKLIDRLSNFSDAISNIVCCDQQGNILLPDETINSIVGELALLRTRKSHVYVIGNGGSAAIASHMMIDLLNMSKIKAHTLYDLSMLTCISNDYGYENVFKKPLDIMFADGDVLIAISSSGESDNILNAVEGAKEKNIYTITLSGFAAENTLKTMGDMNIWLGSNDYGIVEIGHAFILHNIADRLALKSKTNLL